MNFKITYPSGLVENVGSSDWNSVEDMVRSKFGSDMESVLNEGGVLVEMEGESDEVGAAEIDAAAEAAAAEAAAAEAAAAEAAAAEAANNPTP